MFAKIDLLNSRSSINQGKQQQILLLKNDNKTKSSECT